MTLESAIKHCEEIAYEKDLESGFETDNVSYIMTDDERANRKKCADEHRQLAEWLKDYKRLLEQQSSEDKVIITINKGTLKYSDKGYVVYNKDWFRKHFATEVAIMTGHNGYIEQLTSEDCVSRKSLLDKLDPLYEEKIKTAPDNMAEGFVQIANLIKNEPPVTPIQNWIPVSERLPKKTGWYFVTFRFANGVAVCEASYRKPENYWTGKNISKKLFDNNEVVAWQPLPKAYEEER